MQTVKSLKQSIRNPKEDKAMADEIARLHRTIAQFSRSRRKYRLELPDKSNTIRFGAVSCLHLGSLYERQDSFREYVRFCEKVGIRTILVAGDILDGYGIYKGQAFEQYAIGMDAQLKVLKNKILSPSSIDFHFITGNHDESFKKLIGVNIGEAIAAQHDNWHFLGESYGEITLVNKGGASAKVIMVHPSGGTAYAISYHLQKHIEALSGGQKPDLWLEGHYHKAVWLPGYRNVDGFQLGTFQSQTPFMAGKGLAAMIGGWEIEVTVNPRKHLTRTVKARFHSFYEPQG